MQDCCSILVQLTSKKHLSKSPFLLWLSDGLFGRFLGLAPTVQREGHCKSSFRLKSPEIVPSRRLGHTTGGWVGRYEGLTRVWDSSRLFLAGWLSVVCKQLLLFLKSRCLFEELHFNETTGRNVPAHMRKHFWMAFCIPLRLWHVVFFSHNSCYSLFLYFGSRF